jgi:hypothetical protein
MRFLTALSRCLATPWLARTLILLAMACVLLGLCWQQLAQKANHLVRQALGNSLQSVGISGEVGILRLLSLDNRWAVFQLRHLRWFTPQQGTLLRIAEMRVWLPTNALWQGAWQQRLPIARIEATAPQIEAKPDWKRIFHLPPAKNNPLQFNNTQVVVHRGRLLWPARRQHLAAFYIDFPEVRVTGLGNTLAVQPPLVLRAEVLSAPTAAPGGQPSPGHWPRLPPLRGRFEIEAQQAVMPGAPAPWRARLDMRQPYRVQFRANGAGFPEPPTVPRGHGPGQGAYMQWEAHVDDVAPWFAWVRLLPGVSSVPLTEITQLHGRLHSKGTWRHNSQAKGEVASQWRWTQGQLCLKPSLGGCALKHVEATLRWPSAHETKPGLMASGRLLGQPIALSGGWPALTLRAENLPAPLLWDWANALVRQKYLPVLANAAPYLLATQWPTGRLSGHMQLRHHPRTGWTCPQGQWQLTQGRLHTRLPVQATLGTLRTVELRDIGGTLTWTPSQAQAQATTRALEGLWRIEAQAPGLHGPWQGKLSVKDLPAQQLACVWELPTQAGMLRIQDGQIHGQLAWQQRQEAAATPTMPRMHGDLHLVGFDARWTPPGPAGPDLGQKASYMTLRAHAADLVWQAPHLLQWRVTDGRLGPLSLAGQGNLQLRTTTPFALAHVSGRLEAETQEIETLLALLPKTPLKKSSEMQKQPQKMPWSGFVRVNSQWLARPSPTHPGVWRLPFADVQWTTKNLSGQLATAKGTPVALRHLESQGQVRLEAMQFPPNTVVVPRLASLGLHATQGQVLWPDAQPGSQLVLAPPGLTLAWTPASGLALQGPWQLLWLPSQKLDTYASNVFDPAAQHAMPLHLYGTVRGRVKTLTHPDNQLQLTMSTDLRPLAHISPWQQWLAPGAMVPSVPLTAEARLKGGHVDMHLGLHELLTLQGEAEHLWVPGQRTWQLRLQTPRGVQLEALRPYLHPTTFAGLQGLVTADWTLQHSDQPDVVSQQAGLPPHPDTLAGQLAVNNLAAPFFGVEDLSFILDSKQEDPLHRLRLCVAHVQVPGAEGVLNTWLADPLQTPLVAPEEAVTPAKTGEAPLSQRLASRVKENVRGAVRLHDLEIDAKRFNVTVFSGYSQQLADRINRYLVAPLWRPWQPGDPLLPFDTYGARTHVEEVIYQNILLSDTSGLLELHPNGLLALRQARAQSGGGVVRGQLSFLPPDPSRPEQFLTTELHLEDVQANALARALLNLPNQIFGRMSGSVQFTTQGKTDADLLRNSNGLLSFNISQARIPAKSRLESLLSAANILRGGIIGFNLNALVHALHAVPNRSLSRVQGDFQLASGTLYTQNLLSRSPNLELGFEGSIELDDANCNLVVTGAMRRDLQQGPLGWAGNLSLRRLLEWAPLIGSRRRLGLFSSQGGLLDFIPGVGFVPGFGGSYEAYNRFRVRIVGSFEDPASVKGVEWLGK